MRNQIIHSAFRDHSHSLQTIQKNLFYVLVGMHLQVATVFVQLYVAGVETHSDAGRTNNLFVCANHCYLIPLNCQLPINQ